MDKFQIKIPCSKQECIDLIRKNYKNNIMDEFSAEIDRDGITLNYGWFGGKMNIFYYVYATFKNQKDSLIIEAKLNEYSQIKNKISKIIAIILGILGVILAILTIVIFISNYKHFNYEILILPLMPFFMALIIFICTFISELRCCKIIDNLVKVLNGELVKYPKFYSVKMKNYYL